ncbi:Ecdysteroid Kinase 4 [Neodiprion lecontei]|uniref:Uncharacterized protein LOC107221747 n=1 Tax=Neodiprion lecontei TaxID=441921 RepID=A0A6J0BP08_NEOLC|nr:uncharacterized protein LOC107221747 [Neodiprion lecontei]KAJ4016116.1 Ecdysteroid Kinase 4 [Neodiprion lecontei]
MAIECPVWLDACYVQKILRNAEQDESIEVSGITVKPATVKGDNYSSIMHRIGVVFSRIQKGHKIKKTTSLIAKVLPESIPEDEDMYVGFFDVEMSMMSETLPLMNKSLAHLGMSTSLSAKCLYAQHEDPIHLIIEDLTTAGFQMAEREAGLDLNHCLVAIRNLGAFHASSIALAEKEPTAVKKYTRGMFHKDHSLTLVDFFKSGTKTLAKQTATWPELSPGISEKISKLSDVIYEKACEVTRIKEDDFNVLNHADFWINNMLFRYDDHQKPIDYKFVDFQTCHYGSPAVDLLYFFGTSPSIDVLMQHREFITREYLVTLTDIMAKLECSTKPPSFDDMQDILRKNAFYEVIASFTILPLVLIDKSEAKCIDEILYSDEKFENPAYQGESYRKVMTRRLPLYDSTGLLDL